MGERPFEWEKESKSCAGNLREHCELDREKSSLSLRYFLTVNPHPLAGQFAILLKTVKYQQGPELGQLVHD